MTRSVVALFLSVLWIGCDTVDRQRAFEEDADLPPTGITQTDAGGRVVENSEGNAVQLDEDDWRVSPAYVGILRFNPAYPNPSGFGLITVEVVIQQFDGVPGGIVLRGFNTAGRLVELDRNVDASQPGTYALFFNPSQLSASGDISSVRGLNRIFLFDGQSTLLTYGDILVQ
ncbi:MAG: hypothetical protein AAGI08_06850 [Bacteroidota bacterium]